MSSNEPKSADPSVSVLGGVEVLPPPPTPPSALDSSGARSQKTLFLSRISANNALNACAECLRGILGGGVLGVLLGPRSARKAGFDIFFAKIGLQARFGFFFSRKMTSGSHFRYFSRGNGLPDLILAGFLEEWPSESILVPVFAPMCTFLGFFGPRGVLEGP